MLVHTHVEITAAFPYANMLRLISLWRHSWESSGFVPVFTTQQFLVRRINQPIIQKFLANINTFPSVNPPGFDRAAFCRWLASYLVSQEVSGPICSTESDLINYSMRPETLQLLDPHALNISRPEGCPVIAYGDTPAFLALVESMIEHKTNQNDAYQGRPHLSDQDFIWRYFQENPKYREIEVGVKNFFDPDWENAPLVHYGNPFMGRNNFGGRPKTDVIQEVRPVAGWL